jgi:hypothetical protein
MLAVIPENIRGSLEHIILHIVLTCHLSSVFIVLKIVNDGRCTTDSVIKLHTLSNGLR